MKPADDRCEEHGLYLYRTGYGWSCKLGCYYCDDPQKIKDGYIKQYKEELKDKIKKILKANYFEEEDDDRWLKAYYEDIKKEILELLK